jgi:hypothetical protein
VDDVSAIQRCEAGIRPARDHLFHPFLSCYSAFASANQQSWARRGEPVLPVITAQQALWFDDVTYIKRQALSTRSFPE